MNQNKNVINFQELTVDIEREPGQDLKDYLKDNVLGTPGGLRYKHTQAEEKLQNLGETYFLLLRKGKRMIGSVGLCYRQTFYSQANYKSWYIRYFAIKAPMKLIKPNPDKIIGISGKGFSQIREAVMPILQKPCEHLKNIPAGAEKSLLYAYIEKENFQSARFGLQNDFETVRKMTTYVFSRFFPLKSKNVFKITEDEKEDIRKRLREFYKGHSLYMEQNLFFKDNFLVFKKDGQIKAGLQANPDMWEIQEMPGIIGKFLVHVLPGIPGLNRIFNPRKLKFVAADYIFWEPGFENAISILFETACKLNKLKILMAWPDVNGPLIDTFDKHIHQGYVGKMNKRMEVDVKIKFNGYMENEKEVFYRNPTFISSFDLT